MLTPLLYFRATCSERENKLAAIRNNILEDRNYDGAYVQADKQLGNLESMHNTIDEMSALFPDFPVGATYDCNDIDTQIRLELKRQLEDDSCLYESEHFRQPTGELRWEPVARYLGICTLFFPWGCLFPPSASEVVPLRTNSLPPNGEANRPCPVDVSLLDDLQQLRDLVQRYCSFRLSHLVFIYI